ncbi:cyclic nucleotide-binding domain-containing protein [Chloroflexota bacterium]
MNKYSTVRTFHDLAKADLQEVYEQSKQEVLREHGFLIELEKANSIESLGALVFDEGSGLDRWTELELLEISNRFRLFSSPENEIRLYEESQNDVFRNIPRAREFYILALNKVDRTTDAIEECRKLITEGGENSLVWGALGDTYTTQMMSVEQFAQVLEEVEGDINRADIRCTVQFQNHFPEIDVKTITLDQLHNLRKLSLEKAKKIYRQGFHNDGASFTGLGWIMRTIEQRIDLLTEKAYLLDRQMSGVLSKQEVASLKQIEGHIRKLEQEIESQLILVKIALEMEGGSESLDYWTHAGELQLAFGQVTSITEIQLILARVFATVDSEFKLVATINRFERIRDQYLKELEIKRTQGEETKELECKLEIMNAVLVELNAGKKRFIAGGKTKGKALNKGYKVLAETKPKDPEGIFLKKTINFRTLTSNLVPLYIPGGIGRTGSRVPDLTINRHAQEDMHNIVEEKVIKALRPGDQNQPKAVITLIQEIVGESLGIGKLQDLQSPVHHEFSVRSDGLIALSGIDRDMRKGTRSITDLTACLIMQTGDCRETMYLNGAIFAHYQQMQVSGKIREAIGCLDHGDQEGFHRITSVEIPEFIRYQLRGGHVSVYVDSISMKEKYHADRFSIKDPTAIQRKYGLEEFQSSQPLTKYELENAKIRVTYKDGTITLVEPKDPASGKWQPIEHTPVKGGGGIPKIPNTGPNGKNILSVQLLNLVEEHTMSFLYDGKTGGVEICDGFYNDTLFNSPYQFGSGILNIDDLINNYGLIHTGKREIIGPDSTRHTHPVFIEFLPYSATDYQFSLGEGDIPTSFRLMGRRFDGKLTQERIKLEKGDPSIPICIEKVSAWEKQQREASARQSKLIDQKLTKVMIGLARDHPELVQLHEAEHGKNLITQGQESDSVYLILSGYLHVYKDGKLLMRDKGPITVKTGNIVGEISALKGGVPTASIAGNAIVLSISKQEFQRQLEINRVFREGVEELANARLLEQYSVKLPG